MELDQLRYFLKIAEVQSFTRAGEELGITQPALSRSIGKLETELGQPMFERQSRSVALTDAGRTLQERAKQILLLVDDTVAELADSSDAGRIRIGAIPTIAPYFLPDLLRKFQDAAPAIQVIVVEETTDKLLQRCGAGEVDVAFLAAPISARYLEVEPLFEEELFAVFAATHPLAKKKSVSLVELREYPFVLLDETHCLSEAIVSFCRQRSFQPVTVERTCQLAMVEELVALSHGVSLIPRMARMVDGSSRRMYRPVTRPTPLRTIVMAWNPYRFQSQRLTQFRQFVRSFTSLSRPAKA
jgi:LysR family hydrogen peroxide-inducible transcriptional activator